MKLIDPDTTRNEDGNLCIKNEGCNKCCLGINIECAGVIECDYYVLIGSNQYCNKTELE